MDLLTQIKKNALIINELTQRIHYTSDFNRKYKSGYDDWQSAISDLHKCYNTLTFPGGLDSLYSCLKNKNLNILDNVIVFLEADPIFYRSGYIKEKIINKIKNWSFSKKQIKKLQNICLQILNYKDQREFRSYCKLANKLKSESFINEIKLRLDVEDVDIKRRVKWMLAYVTKN